MAKHPDQSGYILPVPIDDGSRLCVIVRIPNIPGHRQAFLGAVSELAHAYNWQSDADHNAILAANVWKTVFDEMFVQFYENDCGENMNCCFTPIIHRVNPETGRLEISLDDGSTWQPDPADPIYNTPALPPPVGGVSATKCDAVSNGFAHIEDLIAIHSDNYDTATTAIEWILLFATEMLLIILSAGALAAALLPLLISTAAIAFAIGKAAWDAYWDTDERAKILCILFCHIEENGQFTQAGYEAVLADIGALLTAGVPRDMLYRDIQAMGLVGLNNICSYGVSADSDCSDCACGCNLDGWTIQAGTVITRTSTEIVLAAELVAGSWVASIQAPTIFSGCAMSASATGAGGPVPISGFIDEAFPSDVFSYPHAGFGGAGQCCNGGSVFGGSGGVLDTVTFTVSDC